MLFQQKVTLIDKTLSQLTTISLKWDDQSHGFS